MKRIALIVILFATFLAGCESLYYDLAMDDKPEATGKSGKDAKGGNDDAWDKAGDVSRLNSRYR